MTWDGFKRLFRANLGRAILMALVVGTVLVMINHGDHITQEPVCDHFYVKCGLSYTVPFLVSIISAMLADRRRTG